MFFILALTILFISPAYYRLIAKGYKPALFIIVTILLSTTSILYIQNPTGMIISMTIPLGLFSITLLLPTKKNAPGKKHLHITFNCPECNKPLSFSREMEGKAVLCPECNELISVPSDTETTANFNTPEKHNNDLITIATFLNNDLADISKQQLEASGITTFLPDSATSHIYPGLSWAGGGTRLMVAKYDVDLALEILNIPKSEIALPNNFTPPPASPESEYHNTLALHITYSILSGLILTPIILILLNFNPHDHNTILIYKIFIKTTLLTFLLLLTSNFIKTKTQI